LDNRKVETTVVITALNEEDNILAAINNVLNSFTDFDIAGEVIVINDGSTDKTAELTSLKIKEDNRVRMISHGSPKGVGGSFWDGVDAAKGGVVICFPGDNENDCKEILRYYKLLEHVDIVIPFFFNREARSLFRNILSHIYRLIINSTFGVSFNYTNGTVLYRKSILEKLEHRSNSFFFQTDILIRLVKRGYLFAEVPYRLGARSSGVSKAISFPSFYKVVKGYLRLVRDIYFTPEIKSNKGQFTEDSLSLKRYEIK